MLIFLILLLSPVLRTLTLSTDSDSIWALATVLIAINILLGDYNDAGEVLAQTDVDVRSVLLYQSHALLYPAHTFVCPQFPFSSIYQRGHLCLRRFGLASLFKCRRLWSRPLCRRVVCALSPHAT